MLLFSVTFPARIVSNDAALHAILQYILPDDEATFNEAGNIDYLQIDKCLLLQILRNLMLK